MVLFDTLKYNSIIFYNMYGLEYCKKPLLYKKYWLDLMCTLYVNCQYYIKEKLPILEKLKTFKFNFFF